MNEVCFWGRKFDVEVDEFFGKGKLIGVLELERKVLYWFSFNCNGRFFKYGKGYIMEEINYLDVDFGFLKEKLEDDKWWFIFWFDIFK